MLKNELIKHSPIRVLEKCIHGGVGTGNLGVFTARKGVGKTACLAHVAIDKLLRDQFVLHISFADQPQHIEQWYRQVFQEVAEHYKLDDTSDVYEEIVRHRFILHFKQKTANFDQIKNSITQIEAGAEFKPEIMIVDGFSFEDATEEDIKQWKTFAEEQKVSIWFSATLHRDNLQFDDRHIPCPVNRFSDLFSVIIMLNPMHDYIDMQLLKDHDSQDLEKLRLKLDPKTMLISNHRV